MCSLLNVERVVVCIQCSTSTCRNTDDVAMLWYHVELTASDTKH